jgi:hypothetical protein
VSRGFILPIFFTLAASLIPTPATAERLESSSYIIQFGNFNVTSGEKSNANFKVTDTVGQTGDGPYGVYGSSNYFVGSGFQYIYQIGEFAFSISDLNINFGELGINTFATDSNVLTVSTRGGGGYTVYAYEQHPLRHTDAVTPIVDTTCDNADCTQIVAKTWVNATKNGFGFNMNGSDVPSDFISTNYFRQFADNSLSEAMQPVMSSTSAVVNHQATANYKVAVSANQKAGNYQTHIIFVAVPGY